MNESGQREEIRPSAERPVLSSRFIDRMNTLVGQEPINLADIEINDLTLEDEAMLWRVEAFLGGEGTISIEDMKQYEERLKKDVPVSASRNMFMGFLNNKVIPRLNLDALRLEGKI